MGDCVFCKIISGDLPATFAYQDDQLIVINDVAPKAPVHLLIIPKEHLDQTSNLVDGHQRLAGRLFLVARDMARKFNVAGGYRLVVNNGKLSGQIVPHLHMHLLGGWKKEVADDL